MNKTCNQHPTTTIHHIVMGCGGTSCLFRKWGSWGSQHPHPITKQLGVGQA